MAVHTPRNVELPMIVNMKPAKKSFNSRKCLCMTCWLFGLVLLCISVFIVAQYLLPFSGEQRQNPESDAKQLFDHSSDNNCADRVNDLLSLEQKVQRSEIIVAGMVEDEAYVLVSKVLKDVTGIMVGDSLRLDRYIEDCQTGNEDVQLFFLKETLDTGLYRQSFRSMQPSSKLVNIIINIASRAVIGPIEKGSMAPELKNEDENEKGK